MTWIYPLFNDWNNDIYSPMNFANHLLIDYEETQSTNLAVPVEQVERAMVDFGDPPVARTTAINIRCMLRQTMLRRKSILSNLADLTHRSQTCFLHIIISIITKKVMI